MHAEKTRHLMSLSAGGGETAAVQLSTIAAMLDDACLAFFVIDPTLHYTIANDCMLTLCGADCSTAVRGASVQRPFTRGAGEQLKRYVLDVMRTHTPLGDRRMVLTPLQAPPALVRLSLWPTGANAQTVAGAVRVIESESAATRRIVEALAFIHEDVGGRLDVPFLASRAGVSPSQFQRDFQALMGVAPKHYITSVRFEHALERLQGGEPIASVAHACGYADQSAFTRRFRAALGMTPTAFIKSSVKACSRHASLQRA